MKKIALILFCCLFVFLLTSCETDIDTSSDDGPQETSSDTTALPPPDETAPPKADPDKADPDESDPDDTSGLAFSDLQGMRFWHGSGDGGWGTTVLISPDGSFSGYYHNSDEDVTGADYPNGTRRECYFNGNFSPPVKIGEFEYSVKCTSLIPDGTVGKEEIMGGVKVIISEPQGFDGADEFRIYLPGKKTDDLSEKFLSWAHELESDGALTAYGLYNVAGQQGFVVFPD